MPIVKVGDKRIKFPDEMSQDQIKAVLDKQFGQTVATNEKPSAAPRMQQGQQGGDFFGDAAKFGEELAAAINRGAINVAEFFTTDQINAFNKLIGGDGNAVTPLSETELGRAYTTPVLTGGMDEGVAREAVRASGELVAPGGVIGSATRLVGRSIPAVRALAAGSPTADITASALSGAGAEIGEEVGGETGKFIGSIAAPVAGGLTANAIKGVAQAARGNIPAAEKALLDQAGDAGIPVLTSDIRPPQTFAGRALRETTEKIPIAGTGAVREAQQRMRQSAVDRVADKYGEFSYDAIVKSLKAQKNKVKSAAGNVIESAGKALDDAGQIPTNNTQAAISNAQKELNRSNVIQSSSAADDLGTLLQALNEPQNFTSLKENRTAFREIVNSTDKADRSQLTSRAKSLLNRVYDGMTKDMESFARKNLDNGQFNKWQKANAVYAEEATKLTRSKLKNILDTGDVTPENVQSLLFSRKPSEQSLLYKSLTTEGRKNARAAIISKVVGDVSRRSSGFTPNAFNNELKKYPGQINTFFKGEEKRSLQGLMSVLEATSRAQNAEITTPTGQQLIPLITGAGAVVNPTATIGIGGSVGAIARLYESAPVRNALLRLGSLQSDSPHYAQALLNAQLALQSQTIEEDAQEAKSQ